MTAGLIDRVLTAVAAYVDDEAGEGTTATALAGAGRLVEILDLLEAFAASPEGRAVAELDRVLSNVEDFHCVAETIDRTWERVRGPMYLIVDRVHRLAPSVVEAGILTDHGERLARAAVEAVRRDR